MDGAGEESKDSKNMIERKHRLSESNQPISYIDMKCTNKNIMDEEYKTDSSNINDDISNICDELLEELEADLKIMNFSHKTINLNIAEDTKPKTNTRDKYNNNKQVFYINKVKMVELGDLKYVDDSEDIPTERDRSSTLPNSSKGSTNTHEEYFDNLLVLIEKAAQDLSI